MILVKKYLLLCISFLIIAIYFVMTNLETEQAITYFPINNKYTFDQAESNLILIAESPRSSLIEWEVRSSSDKKHYLRQDVSLLFTNGTLTAVLNKWAQHTKTIEQKKELTIQPNTLVETISFHHAELHEDETITSIQTMSQDQLYHFDDEPFKKANTAAQKQKEQELKSDINLLLQTDWNELIDYFNIDQKDYISIPFLDIIHIKEKYLDQFSPDTRERIIGQLWEGLYKNYILQAIEKESHEFMPLILLANDRTHILVLYKINNEKHKLIQQINVKD